MDEKIFGDGPEAHDGENPPGLRGGDVTPPPPDALSAFQLQSEGSTRP